MNFNGIYESAALDRLAFPVGGLGAGMFCVEGTGSLSHFSVQNRPDIWNTPCVFSALSSRGENDTPNVPRVLEGPVPAWKPFIPWDRLGQSSGTGSGNNTFGLPRFDSSTFRARFPFATVTLQDEKVPLDCSLQAWSPFIPGQADDSGLPVGALEYRFKNSTGRPIEAVWSFHMRNAFGKSETTQKVTAIPRASGCALCEIHL